jgi:hypothetical protein
MQTLLFPNTRKPLRTLEAWSPVGVEDFRTKMDLLREVVGMPWESSRFPVFLGGSEGDLQVSAGVVSLQGLVKEVRVDRVRCRWGRSLHLLTLKDILLRRDHSWIR